MTPERREVQSCCAAYPHKIDTNWVKNNPGNLFNIPILKQERLDMLQDIAVESCTTPCWVPENSGKISRRILLDTVKRTHTSIDSVPETLQINLGSDCNLTCVYCTKQYSTAWLRDIFQNGPYIDEERYKINANDRILLKLGQKKIDNTESYNLIIDEAAKYTQCKEVYITGGEPFLNNNLVNILKKFQQKVKVYTGLGVSTERLEKILSDIPYNVEFVISAENIQKHYEFVRYKNSFEQFERNLKILESSRKIIFNSVITNLTIFNYSDFENYYKDKQIELVFCSEPDYLSLNVLDDESKHLLIDTKFKNKEEYIKDTLQQPYTKEQKVNLIKFLKEYARRRNLDLNIFPGHFLNWLNTP